MVKMPNFFDAFKMTTCDVCGREVVFAGLGSHLADHDVYQVEPEESYDE